MLYYNGISSHTYTRVTSACSTMQNSCSLERNCREKIHHMLEQGIIEESCSPWMAPAVFVPKKSGEICLYIDCRELNKRTVKDAYLPPFVDEVQYRLSGCTNFLLPTFRVAIGSCQSTQQTFRKLHFVLIQVWGYTNLNGCHLDSREHLDLSMPYGQNNVWPLL